MCATTQDSSDKTWKEKESVLREVSSMLHEGLVAVDTRMAVTFINPVAERLLGWKQSELSGKSAHNTIHYKKADGTAYPLKECIIYKSIKSGGVQRKEEDILTKKDGSLVYVSLVATPIIENGEVIGGVAAFTDITKHVQAEKNLRKALADAKRASKEKGKFMSLIAHDLKTPFTSVISFLRLIASENDSGVPSKYRNLLDSILESSERSVDLIDELLQIGRFQTSNISLAPKFFNGRKSVFAVMANMSHLAAEKDIEILNDVPKSSRLYADPHLFGEVLINLLSNAIKFCGKGDRITFFAPPGECLTIAIRDTGAGIEDKVVGDLFRSDIKTTSVGAAGEKGTGLGLPYSKEIMEALGGSLSVESVPGEGSVFYTRLPSVKPGVLIIEDNITCARKIEKMTQGYDFNVQLAENGEDALKIIQDNPPHLILLDLYLPVMDGFEFLALVKNESALKNIPVIAITAHSEQENRKEAFKLGAEDFLIKPFAEEKLASCLLKHLQVIKT